MIIARYDMVLDYLAKSVEERGGDSCFVHGPNGSYVRRIGNDYLLYDEDGNFADWTTDAGTAMAYIGAEGMEVIRNNKGRAGNETAERMAAL